MRRTGVRWWPTPVPSRGMRRYVLVWVVAGLVIASGCAEQQRAEEPMPLARSAVPDVPVGPAPGDAAEDQPPAANPFGRNIDALADGRRYFVAYNCAGCHGDHGGGGMGPSLRDEAWLYGSSDAHIANSIAEGRAYGMPAWGQRLTDTQVWQIAAYVKSMRTPQEPDAPAQ